MDPSLRNEEAANAMNNLGKTYKTAGPLDLEDEEDDGSTWFRRKGGARQSEGDARLRPRIRLKAQEESGGVVTTMMTGDDMWHAVGHCR